jgi:hypothetical protein
VTDSFSHYGIGDDPVMPRRCEHCGGGDPGGVMVVKRVVTVTYERHHADCPTLTDLAR